MDIVPFRYFKKAVAEVVKGPSGFGIGVLGPLQAHGELRKGVFISRSYHASVQIGRRVVSCNGIDMAFASQEQCAKAIADSEEIVLMLVPDDEGYAKYLKAGKVRNDYLAAKKKNAPDFRKTVGMPAAPPHAHPYIVQWGGNANLCA